MDGVVFRYTSADRDIVFDGATWTSVPIGRSDRARDTSEDSKNLVTVTVPHDHPVAVLYMRTPPDQMVTLELLRGENLGNISQVLKATVTGVKWNGYEATIECESPMARANRTGLAARYQSQCRHALYGRGCRIDREDFKLTYTFIQIETTGRRIKATGSTGLPEDWAVGGVIEIDDQRRIVLGHQTTVESGVTFVFVDIQRPFGDIAPSATVHVYAGCDHAVQTCRDKFSNLANFGGFTLLPKVNPFDRSLNLLDE